MPKNTAAPKLPPFFVVLLLAFVIYMIWNQYYGTSNKGNEITYSNFLTQVKEGKIKEVTIAGNDITGISTAQENPKFKVIMPLEDSQLLALLQEKQVEVKGAPPNDNSWFLIILTNVILPLAIVFILFVFISRQAQGGGAQAWSFGRSRAKLLSDTRAKVTFEDVAGVEEAKEELREVVDYLKNPQKYKSLGARIPKGVLLVGAPGTGKTLLGRAVAGEAKVPFYYISGSDFVELFVGVGASRVRDLFEQSKKTAPSIVFVDEIDAVGRQRGAGLGGGHDEREQTLNQLLVEMDGFEPNLGVIVLAATNRPDVLDPALLRPGRFDRIVVVDKPDIAGRKAILNVHTREKPLADEVDLDILAKRTPGFSGADLENLLNEAALLAARGGKPRIEMLECEEAIDRVIVGPERKSRVISDKEREITAYHEAGHALIAKLLPDADPVRKITILPRGMALGITWQLPSEDKHLRQKKELIAEITTSMGGRSAEEVVFNEISTGAANDIKVATETARDMVCRFGMSEVLGPLTFGKKHEQVFLGRDIMEDRNYSENVAAVIDQEIRGLVESCYKQAKEMLVAHRELLDELVQILLDKEVLEGEELDRIFNAWQGSRGMSPEAPPEQPGEGTHEAQII